MANLLCASLTARKTGSSVDSPERAARQAASQAAIAARRASIEVDSSSEMSSARRMKA